MVLEPSRTSVVSSLKRSESSARQSALRPLTSVYAEDLHLLPCPIDEFVETVINWTVGKFGESELAAAREEFFWKFGKVFDDDSFYHERMTFFLDFFVFVRPLGSSLKGGDPATPFQAYCETPDPGEGAARKSPPLRGVRYSLYEVTKVSDAGLQVVDLFNDARHEIRPRANQTLKGIERKNVFQGAIYLGDEFDSISLGTMFHQRDTWATIRKWLRRSMKTKPVDEGRMLSDLARMHLKALRHSHVTARRIYQELNSPAGAKRPPSQPA